MSQTYELCCTSCRETLWIAQGSDNTLRLYTGIEALVGREGALNTFLRKHLSHSPVPEHPLVLLETQNVPDDWEEVDYDGA